MQRLFTSFANGWPGKGLLIQRVLIAALFLCCQLTAFEKSPQSLSLVAMAFVAVPVFLLVIGLWTPIAGTALALFEFWLAFARTSDPVVSAILAVLGGTLAMIGPGAWSIDARLFGRKHIDILHR